MASTRCPRTRAGTSTCSPALDEASYDEAPPSMGRDHPVSWCRDIDDGRTWYTGIGNSDRGVRGRRGPPPPARRHRDRARRPGRASAGRTIWRNFQKVQLTREVGEPMDLAVLPDRRVLMTDRRGRLRITSRTRARSSSPPRSRSTRRGGRPPDGHARPGLRDQPLGLPVLRAARVGAVLAAGPASAASSSAASTGWRASSWEGDTLDLATEQTIIEVPTQRDLCCHVGGDVGFDSQGNLLLTTGDNTNSWASDGFSPIDERPSRGPFDAQRSSGNTNDLRGKLLRIKVAGRRQLHGARRQPRSARTAGTRAVTGKTRPEIYSMGHRNPFRFTVDPVTDWVYMGEVGPDSGSRQHQPRPAPVRGAQHHQARRQRRLAALHRHAAEHRRALGLPRLRLRHRASPGRRSTAPAARPTTRPTTPA